MKTILSILAAGFCAASACAATNAAPFRVCAMAGDSERPVVGVVLPDSGEAFLLRVGDKIRGYRLESADFENDTVVFADGATSLTLRVEEDPDAVEVVPQYESERTQRLREFLREHPDVRLADGSRPEVAVGDDAKGPRTMEEFIALHKDTEREPSPVLDPVIEQKMKELAAAAEKAKEEVLTPEQERDKTREALRKMAEETGMPPPEDLPAPTTFEEFMKQHGPGQDAPDKE